MHLGPPPPQVRLARSAVVLVAVALASGARGDELCPAGRIAVDYDASERPESHPTPWQLSYQTIDPETAIFVDDGILSVDARGSGAAFFGREEPIGGLAPGYRFETRVRTVGQPDLVCTDPRFCFRVGAHGTAVAQDRVLTFEVWVLEEPDQGLLVIHGSEELFDLGWVDTAELSTIEVVAERDGVVTLSFDGAVRGEILWEDLPTLDQVEPHTAMAPLLAGASGTTVVAAFGNTQIRTEWAHVRYEICLPETENVAVWVQTDLPDEPDGRTLKGGAGETLEGLERIAGTVERIDVVHRRADDPDGEKVVTVLEGPEALTFYDAGDPEGLTRMTALHIPPGEVHQLRVVMSQMNIDLRGETHDVRLPSGGDTGLKVVLVGGPVHIPEDEAVALVIAFDPYASLGRNRQGFWWDPVTMTGDVRPPIGPGRCGPLGDPCPPERSPDPAPDPCVGPDCPRDPLDPTPPGLHCPDGFELKVGQGWRVECVPRCPEGYAWRDPLCVRLEDPDLPTPPTDRFAQKRCPEPEVPFVFTTGDWLTPNLASPADYPNNQRLAVPIHTNRFVDTLALRFSQIGLVAPDHVRLDAGLSPTLRRTVGDTSVVGWHAFPGSSAGQGQTSDWFKLGFFSDDADTAAGVRIDRARVTCTEPLEGDHSWPASHDDIVEPPFPQAVLGLLVAEDDVVFFRIPAVFIPEAGMYLGQRILLEAAPHTADIQFDLYARRDALPTRSLFDLLEALPGGRQYIELPAGEGDWILAVHARRGSGGFILKRAITGLRSQEQNDTIMRVGVRRSVTLPLTDLEDWLCGEAKRNFSGFEGMHDLRTFRIWRGNRSCDGGCDLVIHPDAVVDAGSGAWAERYKIHLRQRRVNDRNRWLLVQ
jgi:hypothetical protein